MNLWAGLGAGAMALAVALGAFGAHGLKARLGADSPAMGWWQTAAAYHVYHALGLFAVAWIASWTTHPRLVATAGVAHLAGILLFSGSLYTMALTDQRWLGAITPIGGTAWIVGWVCLALACRG